MCGIAGLLCLNGQKLPENALGVLKAMTDRMAYRGPDGEGFWQQGSVCFGHRRLSIIDLAGGKQPMCNSRNDLCIVFNGEIYNFEELRAELEKEGQSFQTHSDTETLLNAYAAWDIKCLDRLEGMFAFAIWDAKKQRLFAARDHFGKKPFYYSLQAGFFAFASELGSLSVLSQKCSFANFTFHVAPQALSRYLAYEYVPTPDSIYREAKVLEPASYLLVDDSGIKTGQYWELPWPSPHLPAPEAEVAKELDRLMSRAVKLRMISDVPLGVFLSGGIDSSIVTGLMARISQTPVKTFSIGFREASYDESSYADIVAKYFHTEHYNRILSAEQCADELPGIVSAMDTPMADASCAPTWLLSALTREHVTVALGGDGADELWAGYEHYIGFRIAQWYRKLPLWIREKIITPLANYLPESAGYINLRLAVKTFLAGANAPDWLRVQTMLTANGPELQKDILTEDFKKELADGLETAILFAPTRRRYEKWADAPGVTALARAFHVYVRQFMLDDILVKVDRCSMLHSLEVRAPFLDKKVCEFVARLPVNCKLHGFKRKYLLKKAFAGLLPPQILKRNKRGFQIPVSQWLRGKLRPLLEDLLSAENLKRQGIFNYQEIRKMMELHFSGQADLRKQLWTLLVLQLWLKANKASF